MWHTSWVQGRPVLLAVMMAACGGPAIGSNPAADAALQPLFVFQRSPSDRYDGHGFLLKRTGARPLALTAYHVAGPLPPSPIDPSSPSVAMARLRSLANPPLIIRLGQRLPIVGAETIGARGSQNDLAAFQVIDWDASRALELASDMPAVGDTVWVLALHAGDSPESGPRRHPARVVVAHDSAFVYAYLASANTNTTSGAAVLDHEGRVVGVNVGTLIMSASTWRVYRDRYPGCCGGMQGGEVVGLAVGMRAILLHLNSVH